MENTEKKKVVAVLEDLLFSVKISDAAKRAGLAVEFVKTAADALAKAKQHPVLIIVDLNYAAVEPLALMAALKADPATKDVGVLAYVSHVQGELKQKAHETGADMVLARSAFSQNLPLILKRHAGAA